MLKEINPPKHILPKPQEEFGETGVPPETLAGSLTQVFRVYRENGIEVRLIGSVGIAAALHEAPICPHDIDILTLPNPEQDTTTTYKRAKALAYPLGLDDLFRNKIAYNGETWAIKYREIELEVDPRVFAEREGSIHGVGVPTLDPNSLYHLGMLYGSFRPKDLKSLKALRKKIRAQSDSLPDEIFEPFHELDRMRREMYPNDKFMAGINWIYQRYMPKSLRTAAKPVLGALKQHYLDSL